MTQRAERTKEEKAKEFVEVLAAKGFLVLHPDTLTELRGSTAEYAQLLLSLVEDRIIPNEFAEPGVMLAFPKVKFGVDLFAAPDFQFAPRDPRPMSTRYWWGIYPNHVSWNN